MYVLLAVLAAVFALTVTGFGAFAAWAALSGRASEVRSALSRWSVFDYLLVALFIVGTLFLLADLIGVARDPQRYPYFHYGYLLSGFIYNTLAGLFLFVRLGLTVRMLGGESSVADRESSSSSSPHDDHSKPDQA